MAEKCHIPTGVPGSSVGALNSRSRTLKSLSLVLRFVTLMSSKWGFSTNAASGEGENFTGWSDERRTLILKCVILAYSCKAAQFELWSLSSRVYGFYDKVRPLFQNVCSKKFRASQAISITLLKLVCLLTCLINWLSWQHWLLLLYIAQQRIVVLLLSISSSAS